MDQGSTSASIGGPGSEFLPEFRAIHNKLKKRFLRKPNVSEAGEQFAKLAKKMHSREEPQYEGLCHLAVARCERSLGNPSSESEALLLAARSFLKAENATRSIGCPSLEEHFQASIQSYSHAIQILEEDASNPFAATGLCFEVAEILVGLGKLSEAGTFYQRASDLCLRGAGSGIDYIRAREKVAECLIDSGDYQNALHTLTEVSIVTEQMGGKPVASVFRDVLARCEVFRILLLLLIEPTPQMMSPAETNILEKYSWEASVPIPATTPTSKTSHEATSAVSVTASKLLATPPAHLPQELFLLLQSLVMAVQMRDLDALLQLEDHLVPHLSPDPRQLNLLRILVTAVRDKDQP